MRARNIARYSLVALGVLVAGFSLGAVWLANRQAPRVSLTIPSAPEKPRSRRGISLYITGPKTIISGHAMNINVGEANHSPHKLLAGTFPPAWALFPGTWCWGPEKITPTAITRYVSGGYRSYGGGSMVMLWIPPGQRRRIAAMNLSHSFDLTAPGRYEAQLSGQGMVSNVITFRVLAPVQKIVYPAIEPFSPKSHVPVVWGSPWHHIEIGEYGEPNPQEYKPFPRLQIFIRSVGSQPQRIKLTGQRQIDFINSRVIGLFGEGHPGPFGLGYIRPFISGNLGTYFIPAPLTAYGKLMTTEYRLNSQPEVTYSLKPGIIYIYRKPLAIAREFDLSVYGLYHFSTQLRGTPLRTAHLQ